jgi:hypothetical protein
MSIKPSVRSACRAPPPLHEPVDAANQIRPGVTGRQAAAKGTGTASSLLVGQKMNVSERLVTYRPHRSHARYAPVIAPAIPVRRRHSRNAAMALPAPAQRISGAFVGLIYGVVPALVLWAGIVASAKAIF